MLDLQNSIDNRLFLNFQRKNKTTSQIRLRSHRVRVIIRITYSFTTEYFYRGIPNSVRFTLYDHGR